MFAQHDLLLIASAALSCGFASAIALPTIVRARVGRMPEHGARFDDGQGELREDLFDTAVEIDDTVRMMLPQAEETGVALVVDLAPHLPHMRGDQRRIRQILLHLLSNALKFTAHGTVTVRAYRVAEGMVVQVNDTGTGMRREDFPKALAPFGQVSRKYEGAGLDWALTRRMVELHGGYLELDSVPGQGTSVTVTLPASRLTVPGNAAAKCAA